MCLHTGVREELEWPGFQLETLQGEVSVTDISFDYANIVKNTTVSFCSGPRSPEAQGKGRTGHY